MKKTLLVFLMIIFSLGIFAQSREQIIHIPNTSDTLIVTIIDTLLLKIIVDDEVIVQNPPNAPISVNPFNGSINQPLNVTLSWSCTDPDGDDLLYDVYFGVNSNPPLFSSNQLNETLVLTNLNSDQLYFWKVVASDGQFISHSPVWNFSTEDTTTIIIPPVSGGQYFVNSSVTSSGDGSKNSAWKNFSNIVWSLIQDGDTIIVMSGTYLEQLNIGTSGSLNNNVVILADGEVIIDGQSVRSYGVNFSSSNDYVTVRGFTIRNTTSSCIDMEGGWSGSYGAYRHSNPIVGVRLEYNKLHLTNSRGVLAKGTTRCTFYRNTITTSTNTSAQTDGYFSQASSFNVWDGDSIIISNTNTSPHCDGIQVNQDTSDIVRNCYIEQNNSKTSNAQGIYFTESFGTTLIYNNVVNLTQSRSNAIAHRNLVIGNGNVQFYNNVVFGLTGASHAIWATEQNTPPIVRNNILRCLSGTFSTIVVTGSNTSQVSHNAITGGASVGSNVITGNPLFTNESLKIFTLQLNSLCIDSGISTLYNLDKNGVTRPQGAGWDRGVYER